MLSSSTGNAYSAGKGAVMLPEGTHAYLLQHTREHPTLAKLRQATAGQPGEKMQVSPEQGAFMGLLTRLLNASSYLEVGTFTGYSAIAVALALPKGVLLT